MLQNYNLIINSPLEQFEVSSLIKCNSTYIRIHKSNFK